MEFLIPFIADGFDGIFRFQHFFFQLSPFLPFVFSQLFFHFPGCSIHISLFIHCPCFPILTHVNCLEVFDLFAF